MKEVSKRTSIQEVITGYFSNEEVPQGEKQVMSSTSSRR
jgi:hypothetical protein